MIDADTLKRWREIEEKAAPGPWTYEQGTWRGGIKTNAPGAIYKPRPNRGPSLLQIHEQGDFHATGQFIAHARSTYRQLLDEVERLRGALERISDVTPNRK